MANKKKTNPIKDDQVAENPGLLPYAHTLGSAIIRPIDKGRVKGNAMAAMYAQTESQLLQLKEQIQLLAEQAKEVHDRIYFSEKVYQAQIHFEPIIHNIYHLYKRGNGEHILSMISPEEWGKNPPFEYECSVKLLADHTWDILETK